MDLDHLSAVGLSVVLSMLQMLEEPVLELVFTFLEHLPVALYEAWPDRDPGAQGDTSAAEEWFVDQLDDLADTWAKQAEPGAGVAGALRNVEGVLAGHVFKRWFSLLETPQHSEMHEHQGLQRTVATMLTLMELTAALLPNIDRWHEFERFGELVTSAVVRCEGCLLTCFPQLTEVLRLDNPICDVVYVTPLGFHMFMTVSSQAVLACRTAFCMSLLCLTFRLCLPTVTM